MTSQYIHRDLRDSIDTVIRQHRVQILDLLSQLVYCNSYTHNKPGIDAVGQRLAREMPAGFDHEIVQQTSYGNHHIFRHAAGSRRPILLSGHLDTLCPPNTAFQSMYKEGDILRGPGTYDMKGGDVVMVWALKVLEQCGVLSDLAITCIFSGDEEQGAPSSRTLYREFCERSSAALVFEGGGPGGGIVTRRRGVLRHRLHTSGRAAHAGMLTGAKSSAVEELAHHILAIESLNEQDKTVCANVGRIEGGLQVNAVPEHASMDFEIRYWKKEDQNRLDAEIAAITKSSNVAGCGIHVEPLGSMPPMVATEASLRLFQMIKRTGDELGIPVREERRGGSSDGCFISEAGIPTIDGLGPMGDGDHSEEEHIITDSLFDRIALTAHVLLQLQHRDQW